MSSSVSTHARVPHLLLRWQQLRRHVRVPLWRRLWTQRHGQPRVSVQPQLGWKPCWVCSWVCIYGAHHKEIVQAGKDAGWWLRECVCVSVAMEIKYDVKTVSALLDQFYDKRRLLILSAPNVTDPDYQLQNIMIQVRRLPFTCSFFSWFRINRRMLKKICALCPEIRLWVRPATCDGDRAPGLAASRDGSH